MIRVRNAFGTMETLTSTGAISWLSKKGYGGPYVLKDVEQAALREFLCSEDAIFGFLQRREFIDALDKFIMRNPQYKKMAQLRKRNFLFVGAIDGGAELDFLNYVVCPWCAEITSYKVMSSELSNKSTPDFINVRGNVDAKALEKIYTPNSIDCVVWIGPTADGALPQTPKLVKNFIASAAKVLKPNGTVIVIQDHKTPNFRPMLQIPGAFFCGQISLKGRTQTQHSHVKKKMAGRKDQMIAFSFQRGSLVLHQTKSDMFVKILTMIMSSKERQMFRTLGKKELADLIFDYAGMSGTKLSQ